MIIVLSDEWFAIAQDIGRRREAVANANGWVNYYANADTGEVRHAQGAVAEACVAKYLNLPWRPREGGDTILRGDVGDLVEVRCRNPSRGRDLPIRPKDEMEKPYVLVHRLADNENDLVGWAFGYEARRRGRWNDRAKVWFLSPPLRPMERLRELVEAGELV